MKRPILCVSFVSVIFIFVTQMLAQGPTNPDPASSKEVELLWGVRIPLRDGVSLNATVYNPRPMGDALPVIFTLTPYVGDTYHDRAMYFARHAYVFALVDARGRGNSDGHFIPIHNEGKDGYDVVEWLAEQPWCKWQNRNVGRFVRGVRPVVDSEGTAASLELAGEPVTMRHA